MTKPRHLRLSLLLLLPLLMILTVAILVERAYNRPLPSLLPTSSLPAINQANVIPTANITWSPYGQQAVELTNTGLNASNGVGGTYPMASTAKVMMALLILKQKPLNLGEQGPDIPVTSDIVGQYQQELALNESVVTVANGEQLTEYQALEAMLVPSGTNIADLLASWGFGSISAYTAVANQMAASLGMTQTHFADASGYSPGSVSSAADLIKLGQVAIQNKVIAQIVAQSSVSLPVAGTLNNFNIVLGQSGINGIKTGNTDQAGGVFLFSAPYGTQTIIGAIMNSTDLGTALHDAPEILDSFKANLQTQAPIKQGQVVAKYRLPWGGSVNAVAQQGLTLIDWSGSKIAVHLSLSTIKASLHQKSAIGSVSFTFNGVSQRSAVVLASNIPQPSFWWRVLHNRNS